MEKFTKEQLEAMTKEQLQDALKAADVPFHHRAGETTLLPLAFEHILKDDESGDKGSDGDQGGDGNKSEVKQGDQGDTKEDGPKLNKDGFVAGEPVDPEALRIHYNKQQQKKLEAIRNGKAE